MKGYNVFWIVYISVMIVAFICLILLLIDMGNQEKLHEYEYTKLCEDNGMIYTSNAFSSFCYEEDGDVRKYYRITEGNDGDMFLREINER